MVLYSEAIHVMGRGSGLRVNQWKAIVAMSENCVIGNAGCLPWDIPADMAWFGEVTEGQILVFGRSTFESLRALRPQNTYIVLTSDKDYDPAVPNVKVIHETGEIPVAGPIGRTVWICGGSVLYRETLARCEELYITIIKADYEGDAFFPAFEDQFEFMETLQEDDLMVIRRYRNKYLMEEEQTDG